MTTDFEKFFAGDFQRLLAAVKSSDRLFTSPTVKIHEASWDRKAAFLLWDKMGRPGATPDPFDDVLG